MLNHPDDELLVHLVCHRDPTYETFVSCLSLEGARDVRWLVDRGGGASVSPSRNAAVARLLDEKHWGRILFLDHDMSFTPQNVWALEEDLRNDPKLGAVCGFYIKWDGSGLPICNWLDGDQWMSPALQVKKAQVSRGVTPVQSFGGGFLMVDRAALEALDFPWFEAKYHKDGYRDQDTNLCRKLRDAGYRPSVDFEVCVGHVGPVNWDPEAVYPKQERKAV